MIVTTIMTNSHNDCDYDYGKHSQWLWRLWQTVTMIVTMIMANNHYDCDYDYDKHHNDCEYDYD